MGLSGGVISIAGRKVTVFAIKKPVDRRVNGQILRKNIPITLLSEYAPYITMMFRQ